jgi:hypothetical protein
MTAPNVINRGEITQLTALVREAARLDLALPESVTDELDLHTRLTKDALGTQRELQQAHAAVQAAPAAEFDAALDKLTDASLRSIAASALTDTLHGVALSRLRGAVYDQLAGWEEQAVQLFNAAVDRHGLNEVAAQLPDLTQVVSPIDLSAPQAHAVQVWREGTAALHEIFAFYRRVVEVSGDSIGPEMSDGLGVNLSLSCRLGSPRSFAQAEVAAVAFASVAAGTDAARRYGALSPFVVVPLAGYKLHLSTSSDAAAIRRSLQSAA